MAAKAVPDGYHTATPYLMVQGAAELVEFLKQAFADATYSRAVMAGATSIMVMADQFYGDRSGGVKDRWGNMWWIATHKEDVPPEEMEERAKAAMAQRA